MYLYKRNEDPALATINQITLQLNKKCAKGYLNFRKSNAKNFILNFEITIDLSFLGVKRCCSLKDRMLPKKYLSSKESSKDFISVNNKSFATLVVSNAVIYKKINISSTIGSLSINIMIWCLKYVPSDRQRAI